MGLGQKQTATDPVPPRILVPLAVLAFGVAELAVLIRLGALIGVWRTIAILFLGSLVGIWILRRQGLGMLAKLQRGLEQGRLPPGLGFEGLCLLLAGLLLVLPGLISDALAFLLLLPPARRLLYRAVGRRLRAAADAEAAARGTARADAGPRQPPPVIEVDYEEVEVRSEEVPPRGGWGPR